MTPILGLLVCIGFCSGIGCLPLALVATMLTPVSKGPKANLSRAIQSGEIICVFGWITCFAFLVAFACFPAFEVVKWLIGYFAWSIILCFVAWRFS